MGESIKAFGKLVTQSIKEVAGLIVQEGAPGLVALGILIVLILALFFYSIQKYGQIKAIKKLKKILESESGSDGFASSIEDITAQIQDSAKVSGSKAWAALAEAWREYRETLIIDDINKHPVIRNSVRPSVFFNAEELGFAPGFYRIVPGLFVSCGLFLTFLGLIAALDSVKTNDDGILSPQVMTSFLGVASAKFIMSLAGLLSSIIFTIVLRWRMGQVEHALAQFNNSIEKRLSFLSLEDIALRQLKATSESRDHFREIAYEIAAEIGKPFKKEVPEMIGRTIREGMEPLITQVQAQSSEGVGEMVQTLSERLSGDVGRALSDASGRLDLAAQRLSEVAEKMASQTGEMSKTLLNGSEELLTALGTTLERVREESREGAEAMRQAADAVARTVETMREQIEQGTEQATEQASAAIVRAGSEAGVAIAKETNGVLQVARDSLLMPMEEMAGALEKAAQATKEGAANMQNAASGVQTGAVAARQAAEGFTTASSRLQASVEPIRESLMRLEETQRHLATSVNAIAAAARDGAKAAQNAIETAEKVLGGKARAIEAVLSQLSHVTQRMEGQGKRLDEIDEKLGDAFERYRSEVQTAIDQLHDHVKRMQEELSPALDTLREVVEQAESFTPRQTGAN